MLHVHTYYDFILSCNAVYTDVNTVSFLFFNFNSKLKKFKMFNVHHRLAHALYVLYLHIEKKIIKYFGHLHLEKFL